jgi:hypothetical protein
MEQVHDWQPDFQPERLVAYASAEFAIADDTILAEGAAFRSRGRWYRLRFECGLSADHETVTAFQFRVGDPVPKDQWAAQNLPAVE